MDNVIAVLYLAKKYMIKRLYCRGVDFVKARIDITNVLQVLALAEVFEELQET